MALLTTQSPAIPEPSQDPVALYRTVLALKEAVEILNGSRNQNIKGVAQQLVDLRSAQAGATAKFLDFIEVSTTNDASLVQRTTQLEAEYKNADAALNSRITTVDTARANGDGALAQRATTLEANYSSLSTAVGKNTSDITSTSSRISQVDQARADGDGALSNRITTFEATYNKGVSDIYASITAEQTARANGDSALVTQATNILARANQGTASGSLEFRAGAGVQGVQASYQLLLTANAPGGYERAAGLYVCVAADTSSYITFRADNFTFYTGSGLKTIFAYDGANFQLNGNVRLNGALAVTGSITMNGLALNAATTAGGVTSGAQADIAIDIKSSSSTIIVHADYDGSDTRFPLGGVNPGSVEILINGVSLKAVKTSYEASGNNSSVSVAILPTSLSRVFTMSSIGFGSGVHTFSARVVGTQVGQITIFIMESAR